MPKTVILGTGRTPFGKMGGALSTLDAIELGGTAIAGALERAGVAPDLASPESTSACSGASSDSPSNTGTTRVSAVPEPVTTETRIAKQASVVGLPRVSSG